MSFYKIPIDFVLRGFCKYCDKSIYVSQLEKEIVLHEWPSESIGYHEVEPVWFLSPKQMDIIVQSKSFRDWYIEKECDHWEDSNESLAEFLRKEPFLVAKILREAGEEK